MCASMDDLMDDNKEEGSFCSGNCRHDVCNAYFTTPCAGTSSSNSSNQSKKNKNSSRR